MTNTASILWPTAQQAAAPQVGTPRWTFYTQVSVSAPTVSAAIPDTGSASDTRASSRTDHLRVVDDDFRTSDAREERSDIDRRWGPWSLTQRELEVLQLLAEGATNGEISQRLYISPKTTKNHLAAIFQKLDVTNRTHALVRAVVMGLVTIE